MIGLIGFEDGMKRAWLWFRAALIVTLLIVPRLEIAQDPVKYVNISYSLTSPITLHEPVIIHVTIQNMASRGMSIDLGWRDVAAFLFKIITPDGKQIDVPPQVYRNGNLVMGGIARYLKPHEKFSERIIFDEWNFAEGAPQPSTNLSNQSIFDVAGGYKIAAKLAVPLIFGMPQNPWIGNDDHPLTEMEETTLNLTILPRNETVLKQRCDELIRRLHVARRFDESGAIAEELSYFYDPIVIPYLAKLVEEKEELRAVEGLTRIGTDEAWEAMIAVTKSEYDKGSAEYAKTMLREKIPEIRDPNIRRKVEDAVK